MTLREILDGIIIAYTSFALKATEKRLATMPLLADGISRITVKSGWKR